MFCALSEIIGTFLKIAYLSYGTLFQELKKALEVLVDQVVLKLQIKTLKMLFGSITQEPPGLSKF